MFNNTSEDINNNSIQKKYNDKSKKKLNESITGNSIIRNNLLQNKHIDINNTENQCIQNIQNLEKEFKNPFINSSKSLDKDMINKFNIEQNKLRSKIIKDGSKTIKIDPNIFHNNELYYYGIKVSNLEDQKRLLLLSLQAKDIETNHFLKLYEKLEVNNKLKSESLSLFDDDEKPEGYCSSFRCRKKMLSTKIAIHSFKAYPFVKRLCLNCLAFNICRAKYESTGPKILIEFVTDNQNSTFDASRGLFVNLDDGKIFINNIEVEGTWENLNENEYKDDYIKSKLIVHSYFPSRMHDYQLVGIYTGTIFGRLMCFNILTGKQCLSFAKNSNSNNTIKNKFQEIANMPGNTSWKELCKYKKKGEIVASEYCYPCLQHYLKVNGKITVSNPLPQITQENTIYEKPIIKDINQLIIENQHLNEENGRLRGRITYLEGEILKYQMSF